MEIPLLVLSLIITSHCYTEQELWKSFKRKHSKTYKNFFEDRHRFNIFQKRVKTIEEHNERYRKGLESFVKGINQFSDLTENEVSQHHFPQLYPRKLQKRIPDRIFKDDPDLISADSVDWRLKGAIGPVGIQGDCGSCYAFSSLGALEAQNYIKHNKLIALSQQELVDCGKGYNLRECTGGWMEDAYAYIKDNGISLQIDYPYDGQINKCNNHTMSKVALNVTGYTKVEANEIALQQAVETVGPIAVAFHHKFLLDYEGGIFRHHNCPKSPLHAALLVGYGSENGSEYWIIKNSWGAKWGEGGYFRMIRNADNHCGIANWATYPNIL